MSAKTAPSLTETALPLLAIEVPGGSGARIRSKLVIPAARGLLEPVADPGIGVEAVQVYSMPSSRPAARGDALELPSGTVPS